MNHFSTVCLKSKKDMINIKDQDLQSRDKTNTRQYEVNQIDNNADRCTISS